MTPLVLKELSIADKNINLSDEIQQGILFPIKFGNIANYFKNQKRVDFVLLESFCTSYSSFGRTDIKIINGLDEYDPLQEDDTCTSCEFEKFQETVQKTFKDIVRSYFTPAIYYTKYISTFPFVEAIISETNYNKKYFTTIMSKRDIEIRQKIYEIEMEMHELFNNEKFVFSILHLEKYNDIQNLLKNKNILYSKDLIYAGHAETYINY